MLIGCVCVCYLLGNLCTDVELAVWYRQINTGSVIFVMGSRVECVRGFPGELQRAASPVSASRDTAWPQG